MNKILIIDDDKELCTLIKRSVLSEKIEADICNSTVKRTDVSACNFRCDDAGDGRI